MILRSIQVEGWRCFADPIEVGPFGDGINVIHAPNAIGKSTLFEALTRGIFDGHRVGGNDIAAIRPWGRALAPKVIIVFEYGGNEYQLAKRFLDKPFSELRRKEDGQFVRLAEGDAADDQVRKILSGTPPGRGLSRPEHWGLCQVLWAPQGSVELGRLSGSVVESIQGSLDLQVSGSGMGPLEQRIEAAYGKYFTPKGKLRTGKDGPELIRHRARVDELKAERQVALSRMEEFENTSRKVEDLRAQRAQVRRDVDALKKELGEVRLRARAYAELLSEEEKRNEQVKSARARYDELRQRIDTIEATRKELAEVREAMSRIEADLPTHAKELEKRESKVVRTKARLEEARKGRKEVGKARRQAEAGEELTRSAEIVARFDGLFRKVQETEKELRKTKKERVGLIAPDSKKLRTIRKALKSRDDAQVLLDAALITLEIVPEKDITLEVLSAEKTGVRELLSGKPLEVKGAPEVVVDLEGTARIRARGPTGTVDELRDRVSKAKKQVTRLTREFGTADIDQLEVLYEKAASLDRKIVGTQTKLDTLLSGETSEEIEKRRAKERMVINRILDDHPDWRDSPPDLNVIRAAADEIEKGFIETVESAEKQWEAEQNALRLAGEKRASLQSELDAARKQVKSLTSKESELTADGRKDRDRHKELGDITIEWEGTRNTLDEIQKKLRDYPDDPRKVADTLEGQLNSLEQAAMKAVGDEKAAEGQLQQLASDGPYSALSRVEEEIADLKEEIAREELQANAIRLLHDTISHCRKKVLTAIAEPVEKLATRTLQRIAGTSFEGISLAETFEPEGVQPRITEENISVKELSGGEKEQIHLAVRLALADALCKEERQLVVLDDVLTATDTGRLVRILTILGEESERLQIIVLTCHPERYRGIEEAEFFDLEELRRH